MRTYNAVFYRVFFADFITCFTVLEILLTLSNATEILRPRGVSIAKAGLYNPSNDFTCFDGSAIISFLRVNDDYCDCKDGSDEPGTAACPSGSFHCSNAGHKSINIPSSRVNDGVCDCCDASDEYESSASCVNNCGELGAAAWAEAMKIAEVSRKGNELRLVLSQQGKQIRQERNERLQQLEKEKEEVERVKQEKERVKAIAEEAERVALERYKRSEEEERSRQREVEDREEEQDILEKFRLMDSNGDGKIDIGEIQARQTFDQNRDGAVSGDEATYFLSSTGEMDLAEFQDSGYSRMKPYFLLEQGLFKPPELEKREAMKETLPEETGSVHHERVLTEKGDVDEKDVEDIDKELEEEEAYEAGIDKEEDDAEEEDEEEEEEEGGEEKAKEEEETHKYDEETQKLIDEANRARSEAEEADRAVRDLARESSQIVDSLERDYGIDEEFAVLDGQCFEYTDREYTYRLCPFDQALQRPKNGGAETRLGTWSSWTGEKQSKVGKYSSMLYDKGQGCWNGPQRSTLVHLTCGMEHSLVAVSEPNRCEYVFEFVTPCICRDVDENMHENMNSQHDEL